MDIEARLQLLEQRIQELEDTLDVLRVVASYGPSMDGGSGPDAGQFWTQDCVYDSDNASEPLQGRSAIEELSARIGQLPFGVAHFSNLPIIVIDGDHATVTAESNTYHQEDGKYVVARVSANRWELDRVEGTWQVRLRINRLLDGSPAGREVLTKGVREALA